MYACMYILYYINIIHCNRRMFLLFKIIMLDDEFHYVNFVSHEFSLKTTNYSLHNYTTKVQPLLVARCLIYSLNSFVINEAISKEKTVT